jgi:hypothetical protein
MENLDLAAPHLLVGKLIGTNKIEGKILSINTNNLQVKITKLEDPEYSKYLEVDHIYTMFRHEYWKDHLLLWEIEPNSLKKEDAEVFLQWEKGKGWEWDLDQ